MTSLAAGNGAGNRTALARGLDAVAERTGLVPWLAGSGMAGLSAGGLYAVFYAVRGARIPETVAWTYLSGFLWLTLAPALVWFFEERVIGRLPGRRRIIRARFLRAHKLLLLPVALLLGSNYLAAMPFYEAFGGITGWSDPFYWGWAVVWVGLFTYLGAIGLAIVYSVLAVSRETGLARSDRLRFAADGALIYSSASLIVPKGALILAVLANRAFVLGAFAIYLGGFVLVALLPGGIIGRRGRAGPDPGAEPCRSVARLLVSAVVVAGGLAAGVHLSGALI